jgi:hydroxymethylglutaryl-CoA lyase
VVPVEVKVRLLLALHAAGIRTMEVTSFVSPKAVPQFSDAETVARAALALPDLRVSALIPNLRGLERARDAGIRHYTMVIGATDQFNERNVRMTVEGSLAQLGAIATAVGALSGASLEVGIAVAFGCPDTGRVPVESVMRIVARAHALGIGAISLGDTIGVATPLQVVDAITRLKERYPDLVLALHLHDTRGMGLANVLAGLEAGLTTFDSAVGGLGGCPFAPGATGNIATDDANHMLQAMGIETGIDQSALLECGRLVREMITPELPSHTLRVHLGGGAA